MAEKCNSEKRYYWLKLSKEGFFESRPIKRLRRMPSGDRLCMLYLLLLLKSCSNNGSIFLEDIKEEPEEQIALDIDADAEEVETLLKYLSEYKLLEIHDNELVLTQFQSLVGSKTDAAERMKRSRDRKKEQQSNDSKDVTMLHEYHNGYNSRNNVAIEETEKELEKDSEIDQQTDRQTEKKAIPAEESSSASVDSDGRTAWEEITSFLLESDLEIARHKIVTNKEDLISNAISGINNLLTAGNSIDQIKEALSKYYSHHKKSDDYKENGWQHSISVHKLLSNEVSVLKRYLDVKDKTTEKHSNPFDTWLESIKNTEAWELFDILNWIYDYPISISQDNIDLIQSMYAGIEKLLSQFSKKDIEKAICYIGDHLTFDEVVKDMSLLKQYINKGDNKPVPYPVDSEPVQHTDQVEEELPFS